MTKDYASEFVPVTEGDDYFVPVSSRILEMRELIRNRVIDIDAERAISVTESYKRNSKLPPILKRAQATYDIIKEKTHRVEDFEVIFANFGASFCGSCQYPEIDVGEWLYDQFETGEFWDGEPVPGETKSISKESMEQLFSIREYWREHCMTAEIDACLPDWADEIVFNDGIVMAVHGQLGGCTEGHLIAGFKKILEQGYGAIRKQAQDWIDDHYGYLMGDDPDKYLFYKAAILACDSGEELCLGYARACDEKAKVEKDPVRKKELEGFAESLRWISVNPARTFWEAVQGHMLYHLLYSLEWRHPAMGLGRIDQLWWPYLEKDLADGTITQEFAQEIIDGALLKLNCFYSAGPRMMTKVGGVGVTYQHVTVGGVDPDTGEDATNPITYMVLQTMGRLLIHDPALSLRIHNNTPAELWDAAIRMTKRVGGLPLFQNDEVIIPAFVKHGYNLRDARDYGFIGCQEAVGSGNDFPCCNTINIYASICLTAALNNGVNPMNNKKGALESGFLYEKESFEEVKQAYYDQLKFHQDAMVSMLNWLEAYSYYNRPETTLSISIEGCMEDGKDVCQGGAKYNSYGGSNHGFATVADSLTTIRYMCFDKKLCTTRELYDAFMANWEGYEELQQRVLNEVPHYGNDDPYADEQMAWVINSYYEILSHYYSKKATFYRPGLYGAAAHVAEGELCWATPDGRVAGLPVADATSPVQGRDENGPLAVFNSTLCFDHHELLNGMALNIKIHPSAFSNEEGPVKLRDMIKSYFERGGLEVQFNVVGTDIMKAAKEDPESYRDLIVRIAGFSSYFVELTPEQQDDVISRHEHEF
jgi:formate C-acetyltransferase